MCPKDEQITFYVFILSLTLSGESLSGETIRRAKFSSPNKYSSLSPDEKFRPIKVKVYSVEAQVSLRVKQVN